MDAVYRDCERLGEGCQLKIDLVRQGVKHVCGNGYVLGPCSGRNGPQKCPRGARVVATGAAVRTLPAALDRLDGDPIAALEAAYASADRLDFARELVPGRHVRH